jgi:hypothetical protein
LSRQLACLNSDQLITDHNGIQFGFVHVFLQLESQSEFGYRKINGAGSKVRG